MDNFFNFIDNLDQSVLLLYDNNFFYTNHHLLLSLDFTPLKRPVSLKQIIDSNSLHHLRNLNGETESEIKLITHSGDEKKFIAKLFPFQFEQSDCMCFIVNPKDKENVQENMIGIVGDDKQLEAKPENGEDRTFILQSIQRLKDLNKGDEKFTHINWEEIDSEIENLKKLFNNYTITNNLQENQKRIQIDLNKLVINEIEILKSNDYFRKQVKVHLNLKTKIADVMGDGAKIELILRSAIDRIVEEACKNGMKNIKIESFKEENTVYLNILAPAGSGKDDSITGGAKRIDAINFMADINQFENKLRASGIKLKLNEATDQTIDLSLTFQNE